jgi:hypothetical protein
MRKTPAITTPDTRTARNQAPLREVLPRIYELKDTLADPSHPDAYFRNMEDGLRQSTQKWDAFARLEWRLAALDDAAWSDLKERAAPLLMQRVEGRGWQALWDVFNEAAGFCFLLHLGCTGVHFIRRTKGRTPDLAAMLDGNAVLCEVKTLNVSKDEAGKRQLVHEGTPVAGSVSIHVSDGLLNKLSAVLAHAVEQLDGVDSERKARRIIFTVVHFDDWVGDYQPQYFAQMDEHLLRNPVAGAELAFSPASNLFERTFTMESASVWEQPAHGLVRPRKGRRSAPSGAPSTRASPSAWRGATKPPEALS